MKRILAVSLAVGCSIGSIIFVSKHRAARRAADEATVQKALAERAAELEAMSKRKARIIWAAPRLEPEPSVSQKVAAPPSVQVDASREPATKTPFDAVKPDPNAAAPEGLQIAIGKKGPLQDSLARQALSFVGLDPVAEEAWAEAINNPDLPPNERKDLIEDLNEDGFPDPKNITEDDLPLILSRITLIEEHAPSAMDEVNSAAFKEAYKDLLKMYFKLAGQ
jgi:hypothetical protein